MTEAEAGPAARRAGQRGGPAYFRYIDQWRSSGEFQGLEFSRA